MATAAVLSNRSVHTSGTSELRKFYERLIRYEKDELDSYDVDSVRFLLSDYTYAPLESICKCRTFNDILNTLRRNELSEMELLELIRELLFTIGRYDMLRRLGGSHQEMRQKVGFGLMVNHFKSLIFRIFEELHRKEIDVVVNMISTRLNNVTNQLPSPVNEDCKFLCLIVAAQETNLIPEGNIDKLDDFISEATSAPRVTKLFHEYQKWVRSVNRQNVKYPIGRFRRRQNGETFSPCQPKRPRTGEEVAGQIENEQAAEIPNIPTVFVVGDAETQPLFVTPNGCITNSADPNDIYPMTRKPKGICLVISNENFAPSSNLNRRTGTRIDEVSLEKTFKALDFNVNSYQDLTAVEMKDCMVMTAGKVDHSQFDCFVCCILTHGTLNAVYGTDGKTVNIRDLTGQFRATRCPSLVQKPKLFFIQACQGDDTMGGVETDGAYAPQLQARVPIQEPFYHLEGNDLDTDARDSIPEEADFLYGMATLPGYVSFRSRTKGSWYITKLCEFVEKHSSAMDILRILTKVNQAVSKEAANMGGGRVSKQMPSPVFTLTKTCYLVDIKQERVKRNR